MSAAEDNLLRSVIPRAARKSVTSDLFHQWLESSGSGRDAIQYTFRIYGKI